MMLSHDEVMSRVKVLARPHLTKYVRLLCYSYLDAKTLLDKVSYLSKNERSNLEDSSILIEG